MKEVKSPSQDILKAAEAGFAAALEKYTQSDEFRDLVEAELKTLEFSAVPAVDDVVFWSYLPSQELEGEHSLVDVLLSNDDYLEGMEVALTNILELVRQGIKEKNEPHDENDQ